MPSRCFSAAFLNGAVESEAGVVEDDEVEGPSLLSFCFFAGPKGTRSSKGLVMGFVGVGTSTTRFPFVFFTAILVFFSAFVAFVDPPAFDDDDAEEEEGLMPMGVIVERGGSSSADVKTSSSL